MEVWKHLAEVEFIVILFGTILESVRMSEEWRSAPASFKERREMKASRDKTEYPKGSK